MFNLCLLFFSLSLGGTPKLSHDSFKTWLEGIIDHYSKAGGGSVYYPSRDVRAIVHRLKQDEHS